MGVTMRNYISTSSDPGINIIIIEPRIVIHNYPPKKTLRQRINEFLGTVPFSLPEKNSGVSITDLLTR